MKTDQETLRQERQSLLDHLKRQKRLQVARRDEMTTAGAEERARLTVRYEETEAEIKADEMRLDAIEVELASAPTSAQAPAGPDKDEMQTAKSRWRQSKWLVGGALVILLGLAALSASRLLDRPTPTPAASPTPVALALLPTPTPLVAAPLPVSLDLSGCETQKQRLQDEIEAGGGQVAPKPQAEMQITVACAGDAITVDAKFPSRPAYRIEWVDEPSRLSLQTKIAYGRTFLRAAVAYGGGRYRDSSKDLSQLSPLVSSPEVGLLLGQAWLHDEKWSEARAAFGRAIELEQSAGARADLLARSQAGIGIAHVLETQLVRTPAARQACLDQAAGHFDAAVALQPERALWRLGRARALEICPYTDFEAADLRQDVEPVLAQAPEAPAADMALALAMMAHILLDWEETPDEPLAKDLAEQAIDLAPELPSPYLILSQLAGLHDDAEGAERWRRDYFQRLTLPGQRARALQQLQQP